MSKIVASEVSAWNGFSFQWILTSEGRKAVRASEVVAALGKNQKETSRLVLQHVFPDYRFQSSLGEAVRPSWYLYEHGAVQLATSVKSPESEPFQRYLFDVVVKLFAEGGIILPTASQHQLDNLQAEIDRLKSESFREAVSEIKRQVIRNTSLQDAAEFALRRNEFGMMDELCTQRLKDTIEIQQYERQIEALETFLMCEYDLPSGEVERIKDGERTANIDKMFRRATRKR